MTVEAYPLQWPTGRERRPDWKREASNFDTSMSKARDALFNELKLLGAKHVVLSCNVPLRLDGKPYASFPAIKDPAVAVYFSYRDKQICFACDRWNKVEDNIQAIRKTIEALRWAANMAEALSAPDALAAGDSRTPIFGEWLRGIWASDRNPQRDGRYVRTNRRTGRVNRGTWYELTDGRGRFWEYEARSTVFIQPHARGVMASQPAGIGDAQIDAILREFGDEDVMRGLTAEEKRQRVRAAIAGVPASDPTEPKGAA